MELWVQTLPIYSQFACILLVIALGLYIWANRGCSVLVPGSLGRILADLGTYSHYPRSKEALVHYCNTVWAMYILDCG